MPAKRNILDIGLSRSGALLLFALLAGSFLAVGVIKGSDLSSFARQIILITAALSASLLFPAGTKAVARGKVLSVSFQIVGVGACFVILYLLFNYIAPKPETRTVRIYLTEQGRPLLVPLTVHVRIPGMESLSKPGQNGEVAIELPTHVNSVDGLVVECEDYEMEEGQDFAISDGVLRVKMVRGSYSPTPPQRFPSIESIPAFPSKDDVLRHRPVVNPTEVTLSYRNRSGEDLEILLLDCWAYYMNIDDTKVRRAVWTSAPAQVTSEFQEFSEFESGTGVFCIFVKDRRGASRFIGRYNLFDSENPRLTILGKAPEFEGQVE